MEVQKLPINQIRPYWRNPRNNDKAVEAVKQSIVDYGFNSPLVVDTNFVIIAGHTRYKALLQLDFKEVECVVVDLPDKKAKEYRIADNKTSELSDWNLDHLIPELREIESVEDFQIYFKDVDLSDLIAETAGDNAGYVPPNQEQIDRAAAKLKIKFKGRSDATEYVEVFCPHCGEASYVELAEIVRQPTVSRQPE